MKKKYRVLTWDEELQDFSPQTGIRSGPYSLFALRRPLRKLRALGYSASRGDNSVLVEEITHNQEEAKP